MFAGGVVGDERVRKMATVPRNWAGSTQVRHDDDRAVILYRSERTRVWRVGLRGQAATMICKEALGPSAMARTRHESAILNRLTGVRGVVRPVPGTAPDTHTIMFTDVGGKSLAEVIRSQRPDVTGLPRLALALARII